MATDISSLTPATSPIPSQSNSKPMDEMESKFNSTYSSPLPPCKICGAKASGLHYGVNTCEACKGFFRRAIKFQTKYKCFRQQNCDIIGGRSVRTSCPFCRLQKCLNMGMAYKAIKTGRYTHAKRTENIMEVKRLETVSKSFSFQPTALKFNSNTTGDMDYWKGESIDIKKEPEEETGCHFQYMTTTNAINTALPFHPTDHNSFHHMPTSATFQHMENLITSAPYRKRNEAIPNFHTYYDDNKLPLKSGFPLTYNSQPMDFILTENHCQSPNTHLNLPVSPGGDGFNPQTNPQLDGVYISIPTPPFSSSSVEDNSPFCATSYFPYEPISFSLAENELERNDITDTEMPDSSNSTYTQLLPLPFSGSIPSPSALSSSSLSSSTSSLFLEPAELPTLPSPTPFLMPPHSDTDPITAIVKQIHTNNQDMVSSLVQSHRKYILTLAEYDSNFISTVQDQYVDKHQAKAEMFGITSFVKDEVYTEIFSQTGLDVDGRHEMRLLAYHSVVYYLKSIVSFAHCVPGFNCLCHEDQQNLIKVSCLEQWYLNSYFGINKDKSVILMPNLKVITFYEFGSLLGAVFADKCFEMASTFQKVSLTYEILVLWKIILLLSSDRAPLKEPEKVTRLQEAYLEVLSNLIDNQATPHLLSQIMSLTVKIRDIDTAFPIIFDHGHTLGLNAENLFLPPSS